MPKCVRVVLVRHEYSVLLALPHTSFHHSSKHTLADMYPCLSLTYTHSIRLLFALWIICFIPLCQPKVSCERGVLSKGWDHCSLRVMHRVIQDDSLFSAIQGVLHHQLALCRQRSKWPLFSESNDKAVCIHSHKDSHFHLQTQAHASSRCASRRTTPVY